MDPRLKARIAGLLYLIGAIAGASAEIFIRGRLVVGGNAAATAANILAHESLFRLGGAAITVNHFAAVMYLRQTPALQEQALLSLRMQSLGYNIALVFFGVTSCSLRHWRAPADSVASCGRRQLFKMAGARTGVTMRHMAVVLLILVALPAFAATKSLALAPNAKDVDEALKRVS